MKPKTTLSWKKVSHGLMAISCAAILLPGQGLLLAQSPTPATPAPATATPAEPAEPKIPPEQLEALVAPIALYPDSLLAQTLVASTYPLEVIQLQQWMAKNPELKDKALTDAVAKQPWDPAIQAMATIPELLKRLADDIQWATELGNAFLAQQSDVMDAVQRMRQKAKGNGALETNEQQKVETKVIEEKTVIVVESANPEVIYVPSYSPTVVYGAPLYYPYPPIYYPPPYAGFVTFGVGVAIGAAFWGGGCGWGGNDININRNTNINVGNGNRGNGNSNWSHDSSHRGAAPYSNKATADKFSGSSRGSSAAGNRAGASTQSAGGNRGASASASNRSAGGSSRASSAGASSMDRGSGSRSPSASSSSIGSRDFSSGSSSRSSGFSGGSSGFSGSSARSSSMRGASSMGGRGGGGGRRR
jgi:Protein of unknown function (DUF3300)